MSRRNRNQYQSFNQGRQNGWGIGLYRHPSDGWFGGVCAGLAEYWEVPTWVTRLSAFALFLFTGSIIFWFYVAAWILITKRPSRWSDDVTRLRLFENMTKTGRLIVSARLFDIQKHPEHV